MHPVALSILVVTLCYTLYYFLFYKHSIVRHWSVSDESGYVRVCVMRIAGFLIFLLPYLLAVDTLPAPPRQMTVVQLAGVVGVLAFLLVLINFFAARNPENLAVYPQIRLKKWTAADIVVSAVSWVVYLIGYECLFRGYLFFYSIQYFDLISAIGLNVALYVLVHVPKGYKEAFGSIPMGIVLCGVTYYSGSVWPAVVIHSVLALSNEWFSIYYSSRQS